MAAWTLLTSGEVPRRAHGFPRTTLQQACLLVPGDLVRVAFGKRDRDGVLEVREMYVLVRTLHAPLRFEGEIDGTPPPDSGMQDGDRLLFGPEHVIRSPYDKAASSDA